jgi:hypothetical protein
MAVADAVAKIINGRGLVTGGTRGGQATYNYKNYNQSIDGQNNTYSYRRFQMRINGGAKEIQCVLMPDEWPVTDAIDVAYVGAKASFGYLRDVPGFITSSGFRGCKFYLFRRGVFLHAVHAAREENVGLIKPRQSIESSGGQIIASYDSRDRVNQDSMNFTAVLCVVDRKDIEMFAYEYKSGRYGQEIIRMVARQTIKNWSTTVDKTRLD